MNLILHPQASALSHFFLPWCTHRLAQERIPRLAEEAHARVAKSSESNTCTDSRHQKAARRPDVRVRGQVFILGSCQEILDYAGLVLADVMHAGMHPSADVMHAG